MSVLSRVLDFHSFFLPLRSGIRGNYFYRRQYSVITLHRRSSGVVSMYCACMETVSSYVMTESVFQALVNLGPVVQSIVSLKSSLRTQLVKCFATLYPNALNFFVEKK